MKENIYDLRAMRNNGHVEPVAGLTDYQAAVEASVVAEIVATGDEGALSASNSDVGTARFLTAFALHVHNK